MSVVEEITLAAGTGGMPVAPSSRLTFQGESVVLHLPIFFLSNSASVFPSSILMHSRCSRIFLYAEDGFQRQPP